MRRKSQVAVEFMLMTSLAMVVLVVMIGVLYYIFRDYSEEKNMNRLMNLGYSLQDELILASQVESGYERNLTIPEMVGSAEYSINQTHNPNSTPDDLFIIYKGTHLLFPIPANITGNLTKGSNTITKTDQNTIIITHP